MQPLNSPLELGIRALITLTAAFPRSFDIDRLVLMDYCQLHSADLGGPPSVLPAVPIRVGELGVKRSILEHGVHLMARAKLVELVTTGDGLTYRASEQAAPFLRLIDSPFTTTLGEIAAWAVSAFGEHTTDEMRGRISSISSRWAEQWTDATSSEGFRAFVSEPNGEDTWL